MNTPGRARRGTTLLELMIVMGLFSVLIYVCYLFLDRGITMWRESVDALEIRQQALVGLSRITDEVRDTAPSSIHTTELPTVPGIVFASTKDSDGATEFDTETGRVYWEKIVCYYLETQADGQNFLVRKEETLEGGRNADAVPDPYGYSPVRDPAYFSTAPSPVLDTKRLIARQVKTFKISKESDLVSIEIQFELKGRYKHMVEVKTKVSPRL